MAPWAAMSRRAFVLSLAAMALVAALVIGLRQSTESTAPDPLATSQLDPAEVREALAGAPAPLAALHAQANELLPGGERAFEARLRELRGFPVVVNVWAAWCGPCREELPVFQEVSLARGKEVAFLGVDLRDNAAAARRLLARIPQTWPSYEDPEGKIFDGYKVAGVPSTIFYDETGEQTFVHQGPYLEREDLEADIAEHAIGR
jgi:cytochrome c biogenesis protein CcmG, thiol:disulfide interchange protein DsbE